MMSASCDRCAASHRAALSASVMRIANGVPKGKVMTNLGSLGEDGDMRPGVGVFGVPGALTGSTDTAINLPSVLNTAVPYNSALNPAGAWTAEAWVNPAAANPLQIAPNNEGGVAK